jgi:hypothetical protein
VLFTGSVLRLRSIEDIEPVSAAAVLSTTSSEGS